MIQPPAFFIGTTPVHGDLILAPMDGFTDGAFRMICRELGSAISYTEFINVDEIAYARRQDAPVWAKLRFREIERPVAFQIYGNDPKRMVEIALRLEDLGPDFIDINLGCSIQKIAARGAGAGMLKDPSAIGRMFASLSAALHLPVTAKIRLGWDARTRNYREVARALEDNGCRMIAIHARTKDQGFTDPVDWGAIGEVKAQARIPILGNGNIRTVADIDRMRSETGCDGVMVGRAAIGHPWIFARRDKDELPLETCIAMARRHLDLVMELYGPKMGPVIFRKHAVKYVHHILRVGALRQRLAHCSSVLAYEELFAAALASADHGEGSSA
jgi:tRNA-dihydrouridine synthase B